MCGDDKTPRNVWYVFQVVFMSLWELIGYITSAIYLVTHAQLISSACTHARTHSTPSHNGINVWILDSNGDNSNKKPRTSATVGMLTEHYDCTY